MNSKRKTILILTALILVTLPLSSCTFAFPLPEYLPAATLNTYYSNPTQPPYYDSEDNSGDDPSVWISGNPYKWDTLPAALPSMSAADMKSFDPDKAADYLAAASIVSHDFEVISANLSGGVLYLVINDWRSLDDANDAYVYLKQTFSLTDQDILDIPLFSGCVIEDGYMYCNEPAYEDMQAIGSLKEWLDSDTNVNEIDLDDVTLSPVPVSENLMASLLDDNGNYKNMSYAQFKDYVLGGRTESDFDADFMYFNFQNGKITDMFQSDVEE